jgi:hypothetical protein
LLVVTACCLPALGRRLLFALFVDYSGQGFLTLEVGGCLPALGRRLLFALFVDYSGWGFLTLVAGDGLLLAGSGAPVIVCAVC